MPHTLAYTQDIQETDIDYNDHVNNMVYLRWAHQASHRHWQERASQPQIDTLLWILGRQEIDYLKELKLTDTVEIETYIDSVDRQKCFRHVNFYKLPERILVAKCTLVWVALSKETKKPLRVTQDIIDQFLDNAS